MLQKRLIKGVPFQYPFCMEQDKRGAAPKEQSTVQRVCAGRKKNELHWEFSNKITIFEPYFMALWGKPNDVYSEISLGEFSMEYKKQRYRMKSFYY